MHETHVSRTTRTSIAVVAPTFGTSKQAGGAAWRRFAGNSAAITQVNLLPCDEGREEAVGSTLRIRLRTCIWGPNMAAILQVSMRDMRYAAVTRHICSICSAPRTI